MSTERKSKVYKSYRYKKKLNIYMHIVMPEQNGSAYYTNDKYVHLNANGGVNKYIIGLSQFWGNGVTPAAGSVVKFKSIADIQILIVCGIPV